MSVESDSMWFYHWLFSFSVRLSKFIHTAVCIGQYLSLNNNPLYGHTAFYLSTQHSRDIWMFSTIKLL